MGNKLSIICDGNYHFHKTLHVYGKHVNGPKLSNKKDKSMFMKKIGMDFAFAMRQLGKPDRVIFTVDDYSWRKDVEIEENIGYKGNRTKDESEVDWVEFNNCIEEFSKILQSFGCIVSKIHGCEGDDLMYYWANKLYENGEDVVIMTGDGDISQLVKHNDNNFITVYNIKSTDRKIIAATGFKDYLMNDTISLFDASSFMINNKDAIKEIINNSALDIIDPADVLFEKVIVGDAGDNVPPIVSWQETQKSGKVITRKITTKKAARIRKLLKSTVNMIDYTNLSEYYKIINQQIKIIYNQDIADEIIKKRIERNTILVYLSDKTIPNQYRKSFEEHYNSTCDSGFPTINKWDVYTLYKGTSYENTSSFESDIFKTLGKNSKTPATQIINVFDSKKLF